MPRDKIKEYEIPMSWLISATIKIKAASLADALVEAQTMGLPEGKYVDGSCEFDVAILEENYPNEKGWDDDKILHRYR